MDKIKELYKKVAKDSALRTRFADIMTEAENAGPEETGKKLVAFAKTAGYEVTIEEIRDFFNTLGSTEKKALSEEELDAVAGGKNSNSNPPIEGWI